MKKKRQTRQGHYCFICREHKANEKFSGKGHAKHICKKCSALPLAHRNELQRINKIEEIGMNFFIPQDKIGLLKKYACDKCYPEAAQYAVDVLDEYRERLNRYEEDRSEDEMFDGTVILEELDDDDRELLREDMEELIYCFIADAGYVPAENDKQKIVDTVCAGLYDEEGIPLACDENMNLLFDEVLQAVIEDFRLEGIELETYTDTLTVMETGRLKIRKFTLADLTALQAIMGKDEVMYAWEHGFTKTETRQWLNRQLTRYGKDGYGYFAVILKETGALIGQAGLFKSETEGKAVVELGYIFDNRYWKQGYCTETVEACIRFAFDELKLMELYCSIRPENTVSVRIAEKAGMEKIGECIKQYTDKEMRHFVYRLNIRE
jgi:RimJ/RimL family protein N-acetyltransferase